MSIHQNKDKAIKMVLSILYPLGAFLYSWKDLKSRSTYWVFFLFFIVYGLCFTATFEAADSFRYVEEFNAFCANASRNFSAVVSEFFSKDSSVKDIFVYSLYYLTNILVGANYHVFFALVSIVFGYFYLRSLRFLTVDESYQNTIFFLMLSIIFTLSNPLFNINGVRFWTATWIAVYATFQILLKKRYLYLALIASLPLVHGAYYVYWAFFAIAFLVRRFYTVLPYVFFISFFYTDVTLKLLPELTTDFLPPFIQNMIWSYTESDYALSRMSGEEAQQEALYARILMEIPRYFHVIAIYLLVRMRKTFQDDNSREFLGFVLGLGTLVNLSLMIPSMVRFWYLLIPFYVYLWVRNSYSMIRFKSFIYFYPLIALYPTYRVLRNIVWTTDPILYYSNTIHIVLHALLNG